MAKLIINGSGLTSTFSTGAGNPNITLQPPANVTANNIQINAVNGANDIESANNTTVVILNNDLPLNTLEANTGGALSLNNNYTGNTQTAVTVGANSTMTLTGKDMNLAQVTLEQQSQFDFAHNGAMLHLAPQAIPANLIIQDAHQLADLCAFLSQHNFATTMFQLPLNQTHALTVYSDNKEAANLMFVQNPIAKPAGLDRYIDTHFFETNAINHSFAGSDLQSVTDLIGNIASFLDNADII